MTTASADLLTITYPQPATVAVLSLRVPQLTDADRALIAPFAQRLHEACGGQWEQLLVVLAEQIADEAAYRRVAAARGVLAL